MGGFVAPLLGHLNMALTNFAKGFRQNALVSDVIAPRVPCGRQTDSYYIWDRRDQQLLQYTLRATGAGAQMVRRTLSTDTYKCESHALKAPLPDETRANMEQVGLGQFVSQQGLTAFLQKLILLDKEKRLVDQMTTSLVTNNVTLVGGDQWSAVGSLPATNVEAAKKVIRRSGVSPNLMIIGEDVYAALKVHADLIGAFKYIQKGVIGLPEIAAFFDIPTVLLAGAVKLAADDTTVSTVWDPDDALICYVDTGASMEDISFMKTFVWDGAPGTVGGYGVVVGRDPDVTAKTEVVGVDMYYDQKITAVETGYLIKDASA